MFQNHRVGNENHRVEIDVGCRDVGFQRPSRITIKFVSMELLKAIAPMMTSHGVVSNLGSLIHPDLPGRTEEYSRRRSFNALDNQRYQ